MISAEQLARTWPHSSQRLRDGFIATQSHAFEIGQITTPRRLAHFMAQISHESGGGRTMEENLDYRAARIQQVWKSRFRTLEMAKPFEHNPRALANKVYNGRLGNRLDSEDGYTYRGRGYIQLTGRDNYKAMSQFTGLDLLNSPDQAAAPDKALIVAAGMWKRFGCNVPADQDNIKTVTKLINGGLNGLLDRVNWLNDVWRREVGA